MSVSLFEPSDVLNFWFPDNGFWETQDAYSAWIRERMNGGMDRAICSDHVHLMRAAAKGAFDHWAETPRGRLALVIALDQFPRSLWRNTPAAYAQDIRAAQLVLESLENGHFAALKPWEMQFFGIALAHCEGPDHLQRMDIVDAIFDAMIAKLPTQLAYLNTILPQTTAKVRQVVEQFGRHPHRNEHYGRLSTAAEAEYIAKGDFPHVAKQEKVA